MIRHRRMELGDLVTVLGWAAAEGWNPGQEDAAAFLAADPDGFFLAEEDGRPVAAISVVAHSDAMAFLGLYLCVPDRRGRGIGKALWDHALTHAGARTVGLDGVPDQQANYAASGFVTAGATRRFEGAWPARPDPAIGPAEPEELPALIALDAAALGYAKPSFLRSWCAPTPTRRTLVQRGAPGPAGFATWRRCGHGVKIGPLVAGDPAGALALIGAVAAETGEAGPLVLDVPDAQGALTDACRAAGMACSFTTARMYRGPAPQAGPQVAAAGTLELG